MSEDRDEHFPTTHWTLVARLRSGDTDVARRALNDLVGQYRYTLYAYIRRRGLPHHDSEDALHDFLVKLLNAHAFEAAEETRGRLRGYLGTALGRFLKDWQRDQATRANVAQDLNEDAACDDEARYAKERFTDGDTPEKVFERKWGHALMARVMERLKAHCEQAGKGRLFVALRPVILSGGSLRGHDSTGIAASLGMSEGALRAALNRHLRDYRKLLEDEVGQTVENPGEVDDEIAYLASIFSGARKGNGTKRDCAAGAIEEAK